MEASQSVALADPLEVKRREYMRDIRAQLKRFKRDRFVYILIEPDKDVIRYVGVCTDPSSRYAAHTGLRNGTSAVAQWINALKCEGKLPRMELVGYVGGFGFGCEQIVCPTQFAEAIEKDLIYKMSRGQWWGNATWPVDLLNYQHNQNFLPDGLDADKDHS